MIAEPEEASRPAAVVRRVRIVMGIWLLAFLITATSTLAGWQLWRGYDRWVTLALFVLGVVLFVRLPIVRATSQSWSVAIDGDEIVTSDGFTTTRRLPITALERVIIATDDSGPWGDDVVILLFTEEEEVHSLFPLAADGSQDFIGWLSLRPGFRDESLAKAMGSAEVAEFEVYVAER